MGTRGLLGFVIKGRRLGSYNHMDSYPDGLGKRIMDFLMTLFEADMQRFKARLEEIVWVEPEDTPPEALQRRYASLARLDPYPLWVDPRFPEPVTWQSLLYPVAHARALPVILSGELDHLADHTAFAEDTIFCEYAYYIDMEKRVLVIDGIIDSGVTIPFADFKEGLMSDLSAYGVKYGKNSDEA